MMKDCDFKSWSFFLYKRLDKQLEEDKLEA